MLAQARKAASKTVRHILPHLPLAARRNILFFRQSKRFIPRTPQTFREKIQWRIINDRRELIAHGGDKLAMKAVALRSGADVIIPKTLWHGEDLQSVYDTDWGCDWVLKPITSTGFVILGSGSLRDAGVDLEAIGGWRDDDPFRVLGEWAYGQGSPGYLIEEKIETPDGKSPNDIKCFVFNGEVKLILLATPRINEVQRRFYTPDWAPLDLRQGFTVTEMSPAVPAPSSLQSMLNIASQIGKDYDFIRVDLYDVEGRIYFGEITPYPSSGLAPFSDPGFDQWLGEQWALPSLGEVKR